MEKDSLVVKTEALSKDYLAGAVKVSALRAVSFEIRRGEMVAVMGPSGSGKTTLLNLLGCVDRPTGGEYWLDGRSISSLNDKALSHMRNEKIGFVFQTFNLLPRLTALDNTKLPLLYSRARAPKTSPADSLVRVGLADRAHHRPSQLSGGQQQRVAIARALVMQPAIILADEPTGNLDSRSGEEIIQLFQQLNKEGATIVIVTHDPKVAQHTTRMIVMRDGEITDDQPVAERLNADEVLSAMPSQHTAARGSQAL